MPIPIQSWHVENIIWRDPSLWYVCTLIVWCNTSETWTTHELMSAKNRLPNPQLPHTKNSYFNSIEASSYQWLSTSTQVPSGQSFIFASKLPFFSVLKALHEVQLDIHPQVALLNVRIHASLCSSAGIPTGRELGWLLHDVRVQLGHSGLFWILAIRTGRERAYPQTQAAKLLLELKLLGWLWRNSAGEQIVK